MIVKKLFKISLAVSAVCLVATPSWSQPTAELLVTDDDSPQINVVRDNVTAAGKALLVLENNGNTNFVITDSGGACSPNPAVQGCNWNFGNRNGVFIIDVYGGGAVPAMSLDFNGNLAIEGTLSQGSSREWKENFSKVNHEETLVKLATLDVTEWQYKSGGPRHVGPVAEDFNDTFGFDGGRYISVADAQGVLMSAVKALHGVVEEKDQELATLRMQNAAFEDRLAALEKQLSK